MSQTSTDLSVSSLGADAGIPALNTSTIPAAVRDGDSKAREAYVEGLTFENELVQQLTQQIVSNMSDAGSLSGTDASEAGGAGDSTGDEGASSLLGSSDSGYSSLIVQALSDGIMDDGGLGIASEIAAAADPQLQSSQSGGDTDEVQS
jgi:hypothetical protein